ncbi:sugar ABC transporter ATP-binding protein [Pseudogemmobacter bohemicus]|uniref:sugar ABC transporter ATP-binding protein n=1 Tax=Pseudogemmobacter bohemicus TaxID=2250708 RepID=UPI000DD4D11E|nr:sugar ABC transporter ATP-binding protein [Pseudogemmobacter bohemicus]
MSAETPPILALSGVSKTYGAVRALSGVSFAVGRGEVHAILGENGAGKSTTLKIINGEVDPDQGEVRLSGRLTSTAERAQGDIAMVHQELAVFPNMTVAENIFVGRMPRRGGRIDFARMRARAAELLELFGLQIDPGTILGQLTPGQQQIVEILRAVESDASLLILDEPTSGLNNLEAETLMVLIRRLRASGHTILYVSHRLHEVLAIADHVTVLRDGQFIETLAAAGLCEDDLIRRMVGRNLEPAATTASATLSDAPLALKIEGLTMPGAFTDMALELRRGEILGVFGLEGSGAEDFSQAIFGIVPPVSGRMELLGKPVTDLSPAGLMRRGMAWLHPNRKEAGLYMERSIADNIAAPVLKQLSRFGMVNRRATKARAQEDIRRFAIRVPGPEGLPKQLSGGNQQKVALSACLASQPEVIVLNEPTRGVDVGAKAEMHDAARREAAAGRAVLVFSSDLPELLRLTQRILVMRSRRLAGEVQGTAMTEESVMALAAGNR